ncbi:MAG: F0F1 ATP synthase subunit A [Bacteroidia bacterium]|nr:F0F1 ATP synthase subunit A [Bacteroidia bacterium]
MKTRNLIGFFFFLILSGTTISAFGRNVEEKEEGKEKFKASTYILEHIADSHEWHILTTKKDTIAIYLPVILFTKETGVNVFSSKKLAHRKIYKGFMLAEEGDLKGKIVTINAEGRIDEENLPLDFSMTKTVVGMLSAAIIGLLLFLSLARSYKKTGISHPKGIQSFLEPIILFVRDDIAIPNLGHKYEKYMPYLLSAFFFILINNLMGLIPFPPPFGANVTGNIAITFVLALCTFLITQFSGNKSYWRHIFATPGVPFWLLPVMIPVEIIGMFSKPFALMIRLFANITAGHIIVLSLICLIFIFDSLALAPVSVFFVIFMDCLELLVAFLQAYIFTLLSALFISLAVQEHH